MTQMVIPLTETRDWSEYLRLAFRWKIGSLEENYNVEYEDLMLER